MNTTPNQAATYSLTSARATSFFPRVVCLQMPARWCMYMAARDAAAAPLHKALILIKFTQILPLIELVVPS